jgi:hypothetical protein
MAVTAASDSNQLMQAQADFLREIAQKFDAAINYGTMYELIGQELWVAGRLFGSANPMHRMVGLRLVRQACRDTLYHVQNPWLAARICEGYIWPNLDITDHVNGRAVLGLDNVLNDCADIFRQAEEDVKVVQNYQLMLAALANTPRVDWARFQLSSAYERAGNYREAVHYLKEIKATNNFGWAMRRLPTLEQRAKAK